MHVTPVMTAEQYAAAIIGLLIVENAEKKLDS